MIIKPGMEVEYDLFRRLLPSWCGQPEFVATLAKQAAEVAREAGFVIQEGDK